MAQFFGPVHDPVVVKETKQQGLDLKPRQRGGEARVQGTVERVLFSGDDGFAVLKIADRHSGQRHTLVGDLPGVREGEEIRATGQWVETERYGRQLRVHSWMPVLPTTQEGIRRYLAGGVIPGIGPKTAERLVAHFGSETLEVLEKRPEQLRAVRGIGKKRAAEIARAWADAVGVREVMIFLQSHGITPAVASRIHRAFGAKAIEVVKHDPYRLAEEVSGIGFATADRIARAMGVAEDAPKRVRAAVLHVLEQAAAEGHCHLPLPDLREATFALIGVDDAKIRSAIEVLAREERILLEPPTASADAVEARAFLPALYRAEEMAAAHLARLFGGAPRRSVERPDARLSLWEAKHRMRLAPAQRQAVLAAVSERVLVVTGGPGTGKTTLIQAVVDLFRGAGATLRLAAPTGRAARRLAEATGHEASTLHRLLAFSPRTGRFEHGPEHPIEADAVVVDELSMVDVTLFASLVSALPDGCRLLLVGDVDQLPSVGPGAVLADLIDSRVVPVVRLTEVFRQAARSRIVQAAHAVNAGRLPPAGREGEDFFFIERREPDAILETLVNLVTRRIPHGFGVDPIEEVQVLTPMHRGLLGAKNLNERLQAVLNPEGEGLERGATAFRVGDKVMQLRNDYEREVFNGDLGRIVTADPSAGALVVDFDGRRVRYERDALDMLTLAYAATVHKSQGSEYPVVVLPLSMQHYVMLRRNLLYTAITRGRRLVVLVGERRALRAAVERAGDHQRHTALADRLKACRP
ncbi:MAG: ATP-dependent RecD-like DNA helicase [Deltaproteobacteria bacterium]|nr:MAG: ATP-dependent RecD-like DNA helicase [Deltaproteobacteria bacterium]